MLDYDTVDRWYNHKTGERCVENLKHNRFDAYFFETKEEASEFILNAVSGFDSFGFAGSVTVRSMGLIENLRSQEKIIYDHFEAGLPFEKAFEYRKLQSACDCFISSANAITVTGEILNMDGAGNRISAMAFGPKSVIIIAGMNKMVSDIEAGLKRIREIAAPMDAKSHEGLIKTPCIETGVCSDCKSPTRICNMTLIIHKKPIFTDFKVVLVNQKLGF